MAVVQANNLLEDQSQVETLDSGPYGTFIAAEEGSMSMDVIRKAYEATEEGFLAVVTKQWPVKAQIAAVGSCYK